ncbi:hypothetical protein [uncultured Demequina sp.]|mgnify:CR=1 FL=1|uniref:hypothetical protein n=1 Tax=uncultured Demequina sp. TaxID=693499 RepID=UPI0025FD0D16|nr:hypothetical protein [uncultured Demequina sp.]
MTDHGPGMTWLAEHAGTTPENLLRDRGALVRALTEAGRDAAGLAAALGSGDAHERARAEVRARAVRARLADDGGFTPGQRFASRVAAALRQEAQRQREAQDPGAQRER